MSHTVSIVAVSGSLQSPSKTTVLTRALLDEFAGELGQSETVETHLIELSQIGSEFAGALRRDQLSTAAEADLRRIENATLLIVASPVYRASFTGLFKHVFDFVGQYALIDKPVLLAATGGSERHSLILDHQFRPLFSFFQAFTLPLGVYASDAEFVGYDIASEALRERIRRAAIRGLPIVRANLPVPEAIPTW